VSGTAWPATTVAKSFSFAAAVDDTELPIIETISQLQDVQHLKRLENSECASAFSTTHIQPSYHNVLVVTNYTSNDTILNGLVEFQQWNKNDLVPWYQGKSFGRFFSDQLQPFDYSSGPTWVMPVSVACNTTNDPELGTYSKPCFPTSAHVLYCLAQPATESGGQCTISLSITLLCVVTVCNLIKAICLTLVLMATNFHPLATVGDAISSFIKQPDITSAGLGLISMSNVVDFPAKGRSMVQNVKKQHLWEGQKHRWSYAISSGFCVFGIV
jgi:hypothetical protein